MSTLYCRAHDAEEIVTLLAHAMRSWHRPLADAEVRVGILWATSDDPDERPLKRQGQPVLGTIRVLALKWRVLGQLDALLEVDEAAYQELPDPSRLAFCDHELSHLAVRLRPNGKPKLDAISRPKLRTQHADADAGVGFRDVIARHGDAAIEYLNWSRAYAIARAASESHEAEEQEVTGG